MKAKFIFLFLISTLTLFFVNSSYALPKGFVYLKNVDPTIIQDMRYPTSNNFIGRPIKGYEASECILTTQAAHAISQVQQKLLKQSLSLKVFDCYRPQMAVNDFIVWSRDPNDNKMEKDYYPKVNKADFFKLDYVVAKSGHTRGSTIDLTIVRLQPNGKPAQELAMGTHFDFMDESSHYSSNQIQGIARENRLFFRKMMVQGGFVPYEPEWWHFTLKNEPYSDTYFNFPVL